MIFVQKRNYFVLIMMHKFTIKNNADMIYNLGHDIKLEQRNIYIMYLTTPSK